MFSRCTALPLLVTLAFEFPSSLSQEVGIPIPGDEAMDICEGITCVRKCCPGQELVNITSCAYTPDKDELWKPIFYDQSTLSPSTPPKDLNIVHGFPACEAFPLQPHANEEDAYYLLQDGTLHVPLYKKSYAADSYCVDHFKTSLVDVEEIALLCFEDPVEEESKACKVVKEYVYPLLLMVSCVFLVVTLFVYVCIPELRGKLHGRCLLSMVSSLLVAYILMTVVYLLSSGMNNTSCITCASLKQMSLLASFFWLNVMCFDIWRSLKSMRPASETSAKSRQRFLLYSLYAWGCPLAIGILTIVIQNLPESYQNITRPDFINSQQYCWFATRKAIWYYFYLVILLLVLANVAFFLMVAYILLKSQSNQQLQRARSQNRDRMWLYGKLFLVMGITWVTEVISWQQGTCEAWILTDIINSLQGFTIFLVFVCKKSTRQLVTRRLSKMKSTYSSSSKDKGQRSSSTFFTSLSKSSSSNQNTTSSVVSRFSDSQSSTGSQRDQSYPLSPMAIIRETESSAEENLNLQERTTAENLLHNTETPSGDPEGVSHSSEVDEDCPSIEEGSENTKDLEDASQGLCDLELPLEEEDPARRNSIEGRNSPDEQSRGVESIKSEPMVNGLDPSLVNGWEAHEPSCPSFSSAASEESSPLIASQGVKSIPNEPGAKQEEKASLLHAGEGNDHDSGHVDT